MADLDLTSFDALTFDCYGTLIDWETGITRALSGIAGRARVDPGEVVRLFGAIEREVEEGEYLRYRHVCAEVSRRIAARLGVELEPGEEGVLADSIAGWPAHADTVEALRLLKKRYRLCIVSNIDRDLFAGTLPRLGVGAGGVEFDEVVTAEDVRSYKPRPAHFHEAGKRLGLGFERILHVAESRFHDVEPANALGIACVHVDRSGGGGGGGSASGVGGGAADLTVGTMGAFAESVERAFGA